MTGILAVGSSAVLGIVVNADIIIRITLLGGALITEIWLLVDMTKHLRKWRNEREHRNDNQNHRQNNQPQSKSLHLARRILLRLGDKNVKSGCASGQKRHRLINLLNASALLLAGKISKLSNNLMCFFCHKTRTMPNGES